MAKKLKKAPEQEIILAKDTDSQFSDEPVFGELPIDNKIGDFRYYFHKDNSKLISEMTKEEIESSIKFQISKAKMFENKMNRANEIAGMLLDYAESIKM